MTDRTPPNEPREVDGRKSLSMRVAAIRAGQQRQQDEQDPEAAAARMARRIELDAVPIPASLIPDMSLPGWAARLRADAAELYRQLVLAGPQGLLVRDLLEQLPKSRRDAIKVLRGCGAVRESTRTQADKGGRKREMKVLMANPEHPNVTAAQGEPGT
jgi:hypothetical protein